MALKTVLETLDGIDDAVKPFYTETDGKFVLQVDGVDSHPDVANLKSAYERVKADKSSLSEQLKEASGKLSSMPADFDPEKWAKLKDGKADEAALVELRKTLEAERDEWKGKFTNMTEQARKTAIERDLSDALVKAGVTDPDFVDVVRFRLSQQVRVGDDGKAFVETDMGPLGLSEYVTRWAAKDGAKFVTPPTGAGAQGGKGGSAASKQVTRAEFDAMSQVQRADFSKQGGKVVS